MALNLSKLFSGEGAKKIASKVGGLLPPTFLKKANGQISNTSQNYTTTDLTTIVKSFASQKETIKALIQNSPDAALAASSIARIAITDRFTVVARAIDGVIDTPATTTATALATRLNSLRPHYAGYTPPTDFRALSERAILQMCICGSFGAELVMGKGMVPTHINVFSTRNLKYLEKSGTYIPYLTLNGIDVMLDSPLIVIEDLDQDVETPYSLSPFNSATQPLIADFEFINDLRRAFNKASLPRPVAKILTAQFIESVPLDIRHDTAKLRDYMNAAIDQVKEMMNGLRPEDALVHFDTVEVNHLSAGTHSGADAVSEHKDLLNGKISAGLRTLPSMLGRGESSSTASTEAMLHLRSVEGVQEKLNHMFSTLLTTAMRVLGFEVYVDFAYADPDLRPKLELESFRAVRQARILEQLSYGFISDEEASIELTGGLPSGEFEPLSGTQFYGKSAQPADNPFSNTSVKPGTGSDSQAGKEQKAKDQKPSSNKTTGK